jgi:hypothetical protein
MEPFSLACEDAFHETFKGVSFQDDAAIHIWREAWHAAISHVLKTIEAERYENNK